MTTDSVIAKSADKLVDRPYALADPQKGWDCLNSLREFYVGAGVNFPTEYEGVNESNYAEVWTKDEGRARKILSSFLKGLGIHVEIHFHRRGDLLLFEVPDVPDSIFPGIYLGNGNVLICWGKGKGMLAVPIRLLRSLKLVEVRRLIDVLAT